MIKYLGYPYCNSVLSRMSGSPDIDEGSWEKRVALSTCVSTPDSSPSQKRLYEPGPVCIDNKCICVLSLHSRPLQHLSDRQTANRLPYQACPR